MFILDLESERVAVVCVVLLVLAGVASRHLLFAGRADSFSTEAAESVGEGYR